MSIEPSKRTSIGMLLGYARISKGDDQNNLLQVNALWAAGCTKLFEESASGGRFDRPVLHRMLNELQQGDTVVVWKLDRPLAFADGRFAYHGSDRGSSGGVSIANPRASIRRRLLVAC